VNDIRRSQWRTRNSRVVEGFHDPALGDVMLAVEATDAGAQQDLDAVPCKFGDLGGRHAPVEPRRQACVTQVVGPTCQRGGVLLGVECGLARPVPCPAVSDRCEQPTLHAAEYMAVRGRAVLVQVGPEKPDLGWRDRHGSDLALAPVFQATPVSLPSRVRPPRTSIRRGGGHVHLPPLTVSGQPQVRSAEHDRLLGSQPAVVHDTEEGHQPRAGWLLGVHGCQEGASLAGINDAAAVGAERAVLVTLARFSPAARKAATVTTPTVDLIDGDKLCDLVRDQQIGLRIVTQVDEGWFDRFDAQPLPPQLLATPKPEELSPP
jgi:hypothetical protein